MMYLIVKTCSDRVHHSCGCQSDQDYLEAPTVLSTAERSPSAYAQANNKGDTQSSMSQVSLNQYELRRLETGSPLRLTRSMIRRQGKITFDV